MSTRKAEVLFVGVAAMAVAFMALVLIPWTASIIYNLQ
jgi:hypothetical protein